MNRAVLTSGLVFVACVIGSLYAAMLLGCFAHEVLGHGLTAVAVGGTFHLFVVDPAAHGYASYSDVPDRLAHVPLWAGIGINLLCGALAVAVSSVRPPKSGHVALALLALGTTHAGQALGYSLQGAISGRGDAAALRSDLGGGPRGLVIGGLALAYGLLLDWGMRHLVRRIDAQFAPSSRRARRRWFLGTVLLPFAALVVARPASTVFSVTADWSSRAALLLVVGAWGWWRTGTPVVPATPHRPLAWRGALAWALGAAAFGVAAAAWSSKGVRVGWGPG